jgi:hypothetical protein
MQESRVGVQNSDPQPRQPTRQQYFVGNFEPQLHCGSGGTDPSSSDSTEIRNHANASQPAIQRFLQLLEVVVQGRQRRTWEEPLVDYNKSIMLTNEQYL